MKWARNGIGGVRVKSANEQSEMNTGTYHAAITWRQQPICEEHVLYVWPLPMVRRLTGRSVDCTHLEFGFFSLFFLIILLEICL